MFVVDGVEMAVHDVSDTGVRFATRIDRSVKLGEEVRGQIHFRGRGAHEIHGRIVWLRHSLAALELSEPLPFGTIVAEQEYLSSRYHSPDTTE